jgi:DNA-binding GntR family transcriptional regulator
MNELADSTAPNHAGRRPRVVDEVYAELRRKIIHMELAPGYQALEKEIARQLGVSRTPVREALVRLQQEGLVEIVPRQGMRVRPISARDIREINEVLAYLEAGAAEKLASRRVTPEEMARLEAAIAEMDRALDSDDLDAWAQADYQFHGLLVEFTGNRHLIEVARGFLDRAHRIRLLTTPLRSRPVYSNVNHAAVVEAIRRGDAQTAQEIHRAHKRRWSRELNDVLDRLDLPT